MRRTKMKKIRTLLYGFLIIMFLAVAMPTVAEAAAKPVCQKAATLHYQINEGGTKVVMESLYIGNLSSSAAVTGITSSNKNFQAKKSGLASNAIWIGQKSNHNIKDGEKTTINFKVKQNGKTYKLSSRITFKKFDQVFKSFKIGNKDYASVFAGYWGTKTKIAGKTAKIQVTPASGYKIDKITAYYWHGGENYEDKKIRNGSKISTKDLMYIYVYYHPTKKAAYFKEPSNPALSPFNYEFHVRLEA